MGDWLNQHYADKDKFRKVIERVVYQRPAVQSPDPLTQCVTLVPKSSVNELWVSLHQLDYSSEAKHGCSSDQIFCAYHSQAL